MKFLSFWLIFSNLSHVTKFKGNEHFFPLHINFLNFRHININFYRSVTFLPLIIKWKHSFFFFFLSSAMKRATTMTMRKGWNVDWWSAPWWINFHQSVAFLSLIIKLNNLFEFFFSLRTTRVTDEEACRAWNETFYSFVTFHPWNFHQSVTFRNK